jgi:hypothetical protein
LFRISGYRAERGINQLPFPEIGGHRKENKTRRRRSGFPTKSADIEESLAGFDLSDDRRVGDSRVAAGPGIYEANGHSELSNCARRATYPTHQVKKIT